MESWTWLGAYLVGFALLQVYLYLYFMRGRTRTTDTRPESAPSGVSEGTQSTFEPPSAVEDGDLRCCEACGTYNRNDSMFIFCKACGERLD